MWLRCNFATCTEQGTALSWGAGAQHGTPDLGSHNLPCFLLLQRGHQLRCISIQKSIPSLNTKALFASPPACCVGPVSFPMQLPTILRNLSCFSTIHTVIFCLIYFEVLFCSLVAGLHYFTGSQPVGCNYVTSATKSRTKSYKLFEVQWDGEQSFLMSSLGYRSTGDYCPIWLENQNSLNCQRRALEYSVPSTTESSVYLLYSRDVFDFLIGI